jgi:hypothetical protein
MRLNRRACLCCGLAGRAVRASAAEPAPPPDPGLVADLVAANHILFDQGVVDGFGHVSARHDRQADRFLLSRSIAPSLVGAADIMEFELDGAPRSPRPAGHPTWSGSSTARSTGRGRT